MVLFLRPFIIFCFNSINTETSQTSLQANDDGRPNIAAKFQPLSLSEIDFSPAARTFFVRFARPYGLGEKEGFLRIKTVPAVIVVFEDAREISFIFERGTRILKFLYSNGLRNHRVKKALHGFDYMALLKTGSHGFYIPFATGLNTIALKLF
ncbi:hypothetical protein AVEN_254537-1 [Araneus ventricosus]|uniref:Uncharacterized protein n=1 Tax=Araneus ventricosus TaxID=182803 RepID=A0A4Y2SLH8_ARAVE|nr:hypothetical protein AVEN_254537-1 [Araneus ventricosus]